MKKIGIIGGSGLENITFLSFYGEEFIETPYVNIKYIIMMMLWFTHYQDMEMTTGLLHTR